MAKEQLVTADQVQQHSEAENCWAVIDGQVWDVADFAPEHPGGAAVILKHAGKDATAAYNEVYPPSLLNDHLAPSKRIGKLDTSTLPPS